MAAADLEAERERLAAAEESHCAELRDALGELAAATRRELAVMRWVADRPLPWLAGALVIGVWIGRR